MNIIDINQQNNLNLEPNYGSKSSVIDNILIIIGGKTSESKINNNES